MNDPARVERQLTPVLGAQRAGLLASLAEGADATLSANPVIAALLTRDIFPTLAVLYAQAVLITTNAANSTMPGYDDAKADAAAALTEMEQIFAAVNAPDPAPPQRHSHNALIDMLLGGRADDDGMPPAPQDAEQIVR